MRMLCRSVRLGIARTCVAWARARAPAAFGGERAGARCRTSCRSGRECVTAKVDYVLGRSDNLFRHHSDARMVLRMGRNSQGRDSLQIQALVTIFHTPLSALTSIEDLGCQRSAPTGFS
jgi:hypothetical protein